MKRLLNEIFKMIYFGNDSTEESVLKKNMVRSIIESRKRFFVSRNTRTLEMTLCSKQWKTCCVQRNREKEEVEECRALR